VASRNPSNSPIPSSNTNRVHNGSEGSETSHVGTLNSDAMATKHISISYAASDPILVYESVVLFFSISAFFLQLLHLYRTVWWLPQSYTQYAVKFYLVNPYLIGYVLTLITPRFIWSCCKTLIFYVLPLSWQKRTTSYSQLFILFLTGFAHFYFISLIYTEEFSHDEAYVKMNPAFLMGCLLYPTFVMATTYQEEIQNFLELVPESLAQDHKQQECIIQHKCSNDPVEVRQEVEFLRKDFNQRLRNVLFHSHNVAVAGTLLPCCFAQSFVQYDVTVAIQHFILVWGGSLTLNAVQAFPPKYCDILHSAARHLGHWEYVGTHSSATQCIDWCSQTMWKQGSVVRCDKNVYQARGYINAAEPGFVHHKRFYAMFNNAALFQISLLIFQLMLILLELILLFRSSEWYQMISLSLLQASGGYSLFKLMRDAVVVWRLSLAEQMLKNV